MTGLFEGSGQDETRPFVEVVLSEECLKNDASPVVTELMAILISQGL